MSDAEFAEVMKKKYEEYAKKVKVLREMREGLDKKMRERGLLRGVI